MARDVEIKTKTFFQIPPKKSLESDMLLSDRVVFMDQGFDLCDIHHITECVQVGDLWYQFSVHLARPERTLNFDFKRKGDCLMAQRELTRAWTRTGEFEYEDESRDLSSGEGTAV